MKYFVPITVLLLAIIDKALSIRCYVCNTTSSLDKPFQCSEWFDRYDTPDIEPQDCSNVHGAKYCIKHIGRFEANSIHCYQCNSSTSMSCGDGEVLVQTMKPQSCDHVIGANFCVKWKQLGGGIGAKRYCSSKDLGNYCDYVKNRGDSMEYRSCIFTCNTDGCNHGVSLNTFKYLVLASPLLLVVGVIQHF